MDYLTIGAIAFVAGALGASLPVLLLLVGVKGSSRSTRNALHDHDIGLAEVQGQIVKLYKRYAGEASASKRAEVVSLEEEAAARLRDGDSADGAPRAFKRPSVVTGR